MNWLTQWLNDRRWAVTMLRVRAYRRTLDFSERLHFDRMLQPEVLDGHGSYTIAYPDAIYYVTADDFKRAIEAVQQPDYCLSCNSNLADPPSKYCVGCQAYAEHQS